MLIETNINYRRYFLITGISTAICFLFARHLEDVLGIIIVYATALINQLLLVKVVRQSFTPETAETRHTVGKGHIIKKFLAKMAILALGLTLGVHFMGNRIIIPVLNYVIQIFALALSLENSGDKKS